MDCENIHTFKQFQVQEPVSSFMIDEITEGLTSQRYNNEWLELSLPLQWYAYSSGLFFKYSNI